MFLPFPKLTQTCSIPTRLLEDQRQRTRINNQSIPKCAFPRESFHVVYTKHFSEKTEVQPALRKTCSVIEERWVR